MASADAATTPRKMRPGLPESALRTFFGSTWFDGAAALWNLFEPASQARLASAAQVHAPAAVRSPLPHQLGYDDCEDEADIRVRLHNMPHGARVCSSASGATLHVDTGKGAKTVGGAERSAMSRADGEGGAALHAVSGDSRTGRIQTADAAAQAPAGTMSTGAAPADATRLNSPQAVKAMADLRTQLASKFQKVLTPEDEYRLLKSPERKIQSQFDEKTQTVSVLEDENGIPYKDGETVKPGAKYVPVDFVAFYKDLLYVTKGTPNVPKPDGPNASTVVQDYFNKPVPLIPQEGPPGPNPHQYHGTFFELGPVMDGNKDLRIGPRGEKPEFKEVNAIYFNPAAGAEITTDQYQLTGKHDSAALALLHEMGHAVGFAKSNIGEWALSVAHERSRTKETGYDSPEEQRVIHGIDEALARQRMGARGLTDDQIKAAIEVLDMKEVQGVEDATAKLLGEIPRTNHQGKLVPVPVDPNDPDAHSPAD